MDYISPSALSPGHTPIPTLLPSPNPPLLTLGSSTGVKPVIPTSAPPILTQKSGLSNLPISKEIRQQIWSKILIRSNRRHIFFIKLGCWTFRMGYRNGMGMKINRIVWICHKICLFLLCILQGFRMEISIFICPFLLIKWEERKKTANCFMPKIFQNPRVTNSRLFRLRFGHRSGTGQGTFPRDKWNKSAAPFHNRVSCYTPRKSNACRPTVLSLPNCHLTHLVSVVQPHGGLKANL